MGPLLLVLTSILVIIPAIVALVFTLIIPVIGLFIGAAFVGFGFAAFRSQSHNLTARRSSLDEDFILTVKEWENVRLLKLPEPPPEEEVEYQGHRDAVSH